MQAGARAPGSCNGKGKANNGKGNSNGGSGNGGSSGFSYIPWGPDDPPIPDQYAAFAVTSSKDLRCESVDSNAPGGAFWDLAGAVCRAIRGDAEWPSTTTVPEPPDRKNAAQDSLDTELEAMLKRALRWHADNPDQRPKISYPSASAQSPCRYRIYDVQLTTEEDAIAVKITVPVGTDDFTVMVDEQDVDYEYGNAEQGNIADGLDELIIRLEAPSKPRTVRLAVSNGRGTDSTSVDLPSAGKTSPPPATESPASSGSPSVRRTQRALAESGEQTGAISAPHFVGGRSSAARTAQAAAGAHPPGRLVGPRGAGCHPHARHRRAVLLRLAAQRRAGR
jgi:hypothetical protein